MYPRAGEPLCGQGSSHVQKCLGSTTEIQGQGWQVEGMPSSRRERVCGCWHRRNKGAGVVGRGTLPPTGKGSAVAGTTETQGQGWRVEGPFLPQRKGLWLLACC